ncbi:MAG: hypothetical protein ACRDRB_04855 [Pseudonocardiaceae bacterium]
MEPFLQDAVVLGELMDPVFERGVLGREVFDGLVGVVLFQVAEIAYERSDARALGADLGVRGLEGVLGVERPFAPGGFLRGVVFGAGLRVAGGGAGEGLFDEGAGLGVFVEERAGDSGFSELKMILFL